MSFDVKMGQEEKEIAEELMRSLGLENIQDESIQETVMKLSYEMSVNDWHRMGALFSSNKEYKTIINAFDILQNQNWIMIRQLDKITTLLEKLNEKS